MKQVTGKSVKGGATKAEEGGKVVLLRVIITNAVLSIARNNQGSRGTRHL